MKVTHPVAEMMRALDGRYAGAGLPPPAFLRFPSPLQGAVAAFFLSCRRPFVMQDEERRRREDLLQSGVGTWLDFTLAADAFERVEPKVDEASSRYLARRLVPWKTLWPRIVETAGRAETFDTGSFTWWWAFDGICVLADPPTDVKKDPAGRLHAADSAAIAWSDSFGIWCEHGHSTAPPLPGRQPTLSEIQRIMAEPNLAVRRLMIERYGMDRLVESEYATLLHTSGTSALFRILLPDDESIVLVRVVCPSTKAVHFLRVPPGTRRCEQAIAWTFSLPETRYAPTKET